MAGPLLINETDHYEIREREDSRGLVWWEYRCRCCAWHVVSASPVMAYADMNEHFLDDHKELL